MRAVLAERLRDVVTPMLSDGEQVETATMAQVAVPSAAPHARLGLLLSVLTLGVLTVASSPQKRFVVLTDRRLLVLAANRASGHPSRTVVFEQRRSALRVTARRTARFLLVSPVLRVDVAVPGAPGDLRLMFPASARDDGQAIAQAL
jgi:hypothetical protein